MEFNTSKCCHSVPDIYDMFLDRLPVLVMVTQGFCGDIVEDTFDREQMLVITGISRQKRVEARFKRGRQSTLISIPENYEERLCIVRNENVGREYYLDRIVENNPLPLLVQFPPDKMLTVGNKTISTNHIPPIELRQRFDEVYLLGHTIIEGEITVDVTHVPLYLSELRLSLVTGIKGSPPEKWKMFVDLLKRKCSRVKYDHSFGNPNIAEYDPNAVHDDTRLSYVQPKSYSSILGLIEGPYVRTRPRLPFPAQRNTYEQEVNSELTTVSRPLPPTLLKGSQSSPPPTDHRGSQPPPPYRGSQPPPPYRGSQPPPSDRGLQPAPPYRGSEQPSPHRSSQQPLIYKGSKQPPPHTGPQPQRPPPPNKSSQPPLPPPTHRGSHQPPPNRGSQSPLSQPPPRGTRPLPQPPPTLGAKQQSQESIPKQTEDLYLTPLQRTNENPFKNANIIPKARKSPEPDYDCNVAPTIFERKVVSNHQVSDKHKYEKNPKYTNNLPRRYVSPMIQHPPKSSQGNPVMPAQNQVVKRSTNKYDSDNVKNMKELSIREVSEFLEVLNLGQYSDSFRANMIDGAMLVELTDSMLRQDFGMKEVETVRLLKFAKEGYVPS